MSKLQNIGHILKHVDLLKRCIPAWAEIVSENGNSIEIVIKPPLPSGRIWEEFQLTIMEKASRVSIAESAVGSKLPSFCPERHINEDGTLCVGYNAGQNIDTIDEARSWWSSLLEHFRCQYVAKRKRLWPIGKGLSHGGAAQIQMEMEDLANPLGWLAEVQLGIFCNEGWLGGELPRENKSGGQLVNGRSDCPRGCQRQHFPFPKYGCGKDVCPESCPKQHNGVIRKSCPNRNVVTQLVLLETKRRKMDQKFFEGFKGTSCCGKMDNCPLNNAEGDCNE